MNHDIFRIAFRKPSKNSVRRVHIQSSELFERLDWKMIFDNIEEFEIGLPIEELKNLAEKRVDIKQQAKSEIRQSKIEMLLDSDIELLELDDGWKLNWEKDEFGEGFVLTAPDETPTEKINADWLKDVLLLPNEWLDREVCQFEEREEESEKEEVMKRALEGAYDFNELLENEDLKLPRKFKLIEFAQSHSAFSFYLYIEHPDGKARKWRISNHEESLSGRMNHGSNYANIAIGEKFNGSDYFVSEWQDLAENLYRILSK